MDIKRTRIVDLLKRTDFGQEVVVKGWVRTKRGSKSVNFIALNDGSTIKNVQIVADLDKFSDELMKQITTGACLSVKGTIHQTQADRCQYHSVLPERGFQNCDRS